MIVRCGVPCFVSFLLVALAFVFSLVAVVALLVCRFLFFVNTNSLDGAASDVMKTGKNQESQQDVRFKL